MKKLRTFPSALGFGGVAALFAALLIGCAPAPIQKADPAPDRPPPEVVVDVGAADSSAPPVPSTAPPSAATARELIVRYACDEKQETGECSPESSAFRDWIGALDPASDDLLQLDGPGPGGAAWNPAAALVVLARAPARVVRVGAARLGPVATRSGYDVFHAPYAKWMSSARALRAGELRELEGDALRAAISVVEIELLDPPGASPVLFAFSGGE